MKYSWLPLMPAVFAVSWAAILIRACDAPATVIAFYRMFFAVLLILPLSLTIYRRNFSEFSRRTFIMTLIAGVFLGWHFFFWIESLNHTTIASSVVLVTTQPVFVAIIARLILEEKIGLRGIIAIFMAIAGTILIAGFDLGLKRDYFWGDMLALAGAVMAAIYMFIGRIVRTKISVFPYIFTVYSTAAVALGVILLFKGDFKTSYPSMDYLFFLLLAVGPTLIGHSIYNYILKHIKAHKVSLSIVGEPVLASIWAIFIFTEYPSIGTIAGGIIILSALVLVFWRKG